jgi:hypothetical protein
VLSDFFPLGGLTVRISPYNKRNREWKSMQALVFEVVLSIFLAHSWHNFIGAVFLCKLCNSTCLAHISKQKIVEVFWCVVSGFLLLEFVLSVLICIFLKLNNKSLSLIGFHHIWVFPCISLNFSVFHCLLNIVHCVYSTAKLLSNVYFCI